MFVGVIDAIKQSFEPTPFVQPILKIREGAVLSRLFSPSYIIKNRHKLCYLGSKFIYNHRSGAPTATIYSWSLLMACPPPITNFRFCLKPSNQMLFNNIGFPTKGGMPNVGTYTKKMKK